MNDKLQTELTTWLQAIREHGEGARAFVLEQAPDVVREMVTLGRAETSITLLVAVAIIAMSLRYTGKWMAKAFAHETDDVTSTALGVSAVLLGIASVVAFLVSLFETHTFIAVWFAPRVYIIERAAALLGSMAGKG